MDTPANIDSKLATNVDEAPPEAGATLILVSFILVTII